MSNLPLPVHQQVQLQVNPRKKTWKGITELKVVVPPGQQTVGLHCFNLSIQQVTVNGIAAEFTLYQYPSESLPDLTVEQLRKGSGKDAQISSVSEHAYDQYVRLMHKEQEPELVISIPQQQLQDEAATADKVEPTASAAGDQPAGTPLKIGTPPQAGTAITPKQEPGTADAATPAAAKPSTSGVLSPAAATPLNKQQQQQQTLAGQQHTLTINITFSKPPNSIGRDTSLLLEQQCLVANSQLRRARGWFPCIDSPLHIYTPGAPHCLPYTFELQLTVPPSFMAVCSGSLVQHTCTVLPVGQNGAAAAAANHTSNGRDRADTVVVARTFEYSVTTPVIPNQLSIAVGPFVAIQYSDLPSAAGTAAAALPAGSPVITIFAPVSSSVAAAALAQQQLEASNSTGDSSRSSSSKNAAVKCLGPGQLRRLADTVKPLSVLLRAYDKVLSCMFPWSHLQVAVVPDGCLLNQWQAGLGSILLRDSCCITDNLVLDPRLASASCLAAALAQQYFGLLLLPKGPEDTWLLKGLAGWLEGQGLKQIVGSNELHYRQWQERVWLSAIDDGEQLGPLSPQIKEGDKGFTAAWGRLHGTQDLEPSPAMVWKATAVIHMLERKIGEDELRKVLERYVNGAKHAAANTAATLHQPDTAALTAASPAQRPLPAAVPTTSGTTAGGTAVAHTAAVAAVPAGVAATAGAAGGLAERFMTTAKFMRTMGKKQGFKKEAPGFFNRWVHGTGIPQLSAGVSWDSKRSLLLLALRQAGSKAVMQGAVKASEPVVLGGENTGGAAPGGRACTLKVLVRELDACEEHPLQVDASSSLSLHDIKVTSKLGPQRRRMQAAAAASARRGSSSWVGGAAEDLDVSEAELRGVPVLWVQVDHSMEWLAAVQLRQPAHWWALQLEHSKDVVAQAQAVAGLSAQLGGPSSSPQLDKYIISVLGALVRNPGVFCRVRLDAAMALGGAAGKHQNNDAAIELFKFVRDRLYDPYTGLMQPNDFTDLGEALLNHGLPAALARITMLGGYTPEGILAQLLELLSCSDNSSNPVDDGHWLAALVTALGQLRLSNAAELAKVLKELDRMLAHEAVVGTHNAVLGCACLKAVTQLATQMQHSGSAALLAQVRQMLLEYTSNDSSSSSGSSSRHLKATAYGCLLQVAAANAEAQLRDMMAGLEAAAAAAAAASGQGSMQADQQLYQQQLQQIAYTASYSQLLQQLLILTANTELKPPLLLDGMLNTMLQLLKAEADPVHRLDISKEALLLIGQLEQQGYFELRPSAVLPDSVAAAAVGAAAVPAVVDAPVPTEGAADAPSTAVAAADGAPPPQQIEGDPQPQPATATAAPQPTAAVAAGDGAGVPPAAVAAPLMQQQVQSVVPVSVDMLLRVQQLLNHHHEPAVRQLAFMLLQKLAGQPATLYREREEDEEDLTVAAAATTAITAPGNTAAAPAGTAERAAAGGGPAVSGGGAPSGSMRTGMTGGGRAKSSMPAASAGGMSVQHTGTTAPTKLRLGKVGIKRPPSAGGTASPAAAPASTAATAAASDTVQGSSAGTATAPAASQPELQMKVEPVAAAAAAGSQPTPSSAVVTPFAAAEQQQSKVDRAPSLPPLHPTAAAASPTVQPSQQQQQQITATVPSVAASVAQPPAPAAAAAASATLPAALAAAGVPVRTKPLTKLKTLPGSTGNLAVQPPTAAGQPAAAVPAQQQQQQQRPLAGVKRAASPQEAAPGAAAAGGTGAGPAAAAAAPPPPAAKRQKLKKAGIPGQPALPAAHAAAAAAALPASAPAAAAAPPAAAAMAPAPSAAPSSSNVTASTVSAVKPRLKFKIPLKKKE